MHDHLWLRMWVQHRNSSDQTRDIVLPLRSSGDRPDLLRAS
jgi:hypothetical protein